MKNIQDKTNFLKKEGISIGTIIDNTGQNIGLGSQFRSSNNTTTYRRPAIRHKASAIYNDILAECSEMDGFDALHKTDRYGLFSLPDANLTQGIQKNVIMKRGGGLPTPGDFHVALKKAKAFQLYNKLQPDFEVGFAKQVFPYFSPNGGPMEAQFLREVQGLVLAHLDHPQLNVPFLCKKLGTSKSSLHRRLVMLTGRGAKHFIQNARLEKARDLLLADPNCKIATAAYECGFSDPDYFAKVFKGKYGQSPSEWRENHRK